MPLMAAFSLSVISGAKAMKTLTVISLLALTLGAAAMDVNDSDTYYGDSWDNIMAKVHGTCTRLTCPPGTRVKVDAVPGDTGIAETWDRQVVELLELVGMKFVVMGTDGHSSSAWVLAPGGIAYSIQWMFLKKVAEKKPKG